MHIKAQRNFHPKILFGPIVNIGYLSRPELEAFNGAFHLVDLESGVDVVRLPGFSLKDYVITQTFGYCNGMICAEVLKKSAKNYFKNRHPLFGNPSTGVYKILPDPTDENPPRNLLVGFGYDSSLDDYKFVRVDHISRNARIFSVQSNSWKTVVGASDKYSVEPIEPMEYSDYNLGSPFGRSIYWLVPSNNMIVGFDLKYEEFSNVPLPCDMQIDELSLKLVGGTLCIINLCRKNNEVVMWSMSKEEEKGKNSWIKMMAVTISAIEFGFYFKIHPLSYMKDGKILFCLWHYIGNIFTRLFKGNRYMLFFYSCFTSSSLMELAERGVSAWSGGMKYCHPLNFVHVNESVPCLLNGPENHDIISFHGGSMFEKLIEENASGEVVSLIGGLRLRKPYLRLMPQKCEVDALRHVRLEAQKMYSFHF
ncbi:hypothetical protein LguiB_020723 [Lonicera macranthoides]